MPAWTLVTALVTLGLAGCGGLSKLDYSEILHRGGWQLPDRVIESLDIEPGDHVADLGAGQGYFLPFLSEAVGPTGRVYAVEVEEEIVSRLEVRVADEGYENVVVLRGGYADPKLPDGRIDLVFLVNTYHHIEDRSVYFADLRADLSSDGRVAVIDPNQDLRGVLRLFLDEGHTSSAPAVVAEMEAAGYRASESHDFLPTQLFEVFAIDAQRR